MQVGVVQDTVVPARAAASDPDGVGWHCSYPADEPRLLGNNHLLFSNHWLVRMRESAIMSLLNVL